MLSHGISKMSAKNKYACVKLTVTQVLTKTTNIGFLLVTENEVNELVLIANNNLQKLKQLIRYKTFLAL